jgi:conjugal transfer pilus assembly protein TraB
MKKLWNDLDAKKRRLVVVVSAVAVFSGIVAILPGGDDEKERRMKPEEQVVRSIITDRNTEGARMERLIAQIDNMRKENRELRADLERVTRDFQRVEMGELGPAISREMQAIREHVQSLEDGIRHGDLDLSKLDRSQLGTGQPSNETTEVFLGEAPTQQPVVRQPVTQDLGATTDGTPIIAEPSSPVMSDLPVGSAAAAASVAGGIEPGAMEEAKEEIWAQPAVTPPSTDERGRGSARGDATMPAPGAMRVIEAQKTPEEIEQELAEQQTEEEAVYLPPGSIITGTLISGMDAPTGQGARQDPFPALLRIKHEAILPNRFRADVRECFALLGGYGDLSSERAYLRGETFSCIREDGKVLEAKFEAYAVGEDGKAGLRGRLVSKQGQLLAKSLTAGVLQGFSSAFNNVPVPTLSLDPEDGNGQQLYQQAFSEDALQSGAVTGVGRALDRLAQFYIDQAEGMYPVIEIDAGREVEIVLVSGGRLGIQ